MPSMGVSPFPFGRGGGRLLIIRITEIVVFLDVGVLTHIFVLRGWVDESLFVVVLKSADKEDDVTVLDSRYDEAEDAYTHADTLGTEIVAKAGSGVEAVAVDFELVVFVEGLQQFLVGFSRISFAEDSSKIGDGVVDAVALNAVVIVDALKDIVHHFALHLRFGRYGDNSYHEENEQDSNEDDNPAQTAMIELLSYGLLCAIRIFCVLFHDSNGFCYFDVFSLRFRHYYE